MTVESRGSKVEVKCKSCKVSFMARVADRKRGWGKFCSKKCKAKKQSQSGGSDKYHRSSEIDPDYDADHEAGMNALHEDYMADCGQR